MNKLTKIAVSILFILGTSTHSMAQSVGSLEINPDARSTGMGGASVALDANAFGVFQNMSAVAFAKEETAVAYGYTKWFGKNHMHTISGFYQLNEKHNLAFGVRYFDAEKVYNSDDGVVMREVSPYDIVFDLGYAYKINPMMSASANLRYIHSKINEGPGIDRGNAFAIDLGFSFRKEALSAGAVVSGLGTKVDYGFGKYEMPARALAGIAYSVELAEDHKFTGTVEGDYRFLPSDNSTLSGGAGLEYTFMELFSLRGGYRIADKKKSTGNYGVLGCGVNFGMLTADFSRILAKHDVMIRNAWQISVGLNF